MTALKWLDDNWKKVATVVIGGLVVYLGLGPYKDTPEVQAVVFVLKGLLALIGVSA